MVSPLTYKIYDLDMATAISIDRAHNKTIRCVETHLWITEEGWAQDIIVAPGGCYTIKGKGRVVIATLDRWSRFVISCQPGWITSLVRRLQRAWALRKQKQTPHVCGNETPTR